MQLEGHLAWQGILHGLLFYRGSAHYTTMFRTAALSPSEQFMQQSCLPGCVTVLTEGHLTYEGFVIDEPREGYTQAPALPLKLHALLHMSQYLGC